MTSYYGNDMHLNHLKQFTSDDDFGPSLSPTSSDDAEPPKDEAPTATTSSSSSHEQSPASEPSQTETEHRYPSRVCRSPDRYCDTYMYT